MALIQLNHVTVSVFTGNEGGSLKRFLIQGWRRNRERKIILHDVTFEARPGDRVGILGLNGSGKTTLIKTIAGIMPIASGLRRVEGSISAVMASGLGLDGEYTVSDNIKLGLSYFGALHRYHVDLEEAVLRFAGLEERRYDLFKTLSSGYQARLAFSILLFLQSDILLIDEILAAGDVNFVQKSKEAMLRQINRSKITVFVSHSPEQVCEICNRGLVLHEGRIIFDGSVKEAAERYRAIAAGVLS